MPEDNYLNFAGKCWRIVRVLGDGSVKIILEDSNEVCSETMDSNWNLGYANWGYNIDKKSYLNPVTNKDESLLNIFFEFQSALGNNINYLKAGDWCMNDKAYEDESGRIKLSESDLEKRYANRQSFYYDSYVRLSGNVKEEPTLKCNGTILNKYNDNVDMYVATLTADEIVYAGGKLYTENTNFYLKGSDSWWVLSPNQFNGESDNLFNVLNNGFIAHFNVESYFASRPAVNLLASVRISRGDGTINNPYVIS